jgi:predicted ATPase
MGDRLPERKKSLPTAVPCGLLCFRVVFRRFLGAFARPEHPLALFLDDSQWLDAVTIELLEHLITDPDVRHLMLNGPTVRNEVSSTHSLVHFGEYPQDRSEYTGNCAAASPARRYSAWSGCCTR